MCIQAFLISGRVAFKNVSEIYHLRGQALCISTQQCSGVWGILPQENSYFLDFLRIDLVGFGQNIQHVQYTDILEVSLTLICPF